MTKQTCKYHDVYCGISEIEPLILDKAPQSFAVAAIEMDLVIKALERIASKMKLKILSWPTCPNKNGNVTISRFTLDRAHKTVFGHWGCGCQIEDDEVNEWDEDTIEMDTDS